MDKTQIRIAATIILIRDQGNGPAVLMGQRGANAAFMPNKFVFPGGAVDAGDAHIELISGLSEPCSARISGTCESDIAQALPVAAIRELWEETGLVLGNRGNWPSPPKDWVDFAKTGNRPSAEGLRFVFRAITPPGRPRRFDARFFMADAKMIAGDPDDFSAASDELSHLQWIPLSEVRKFDLPFITSVVLAEISSNPDCTSAPESVPFFKSGDEETAFERIGLTTATGG